MEGNDVQKNNTQQDLSALMVGQQEAPASPQPPKIAFTPVESFVSSAGDVSNSSSAVTPVSPLAIEVGGVAERAKENLEFLREIKHLKTRRI